MLLHKNLWVNTAVMSSYSRATLVFLGLLLTGCNYASQYEAQLACEEWVKSGGSFVEHYRNQNYNPEPAEEDCTRVHDERSKRVDPMDGSIPQFDEHALCDLENQSIREGRDIGLYDERRYIKEKIALRECRLEEQTRQYLGFTLKSGQTKGKTVLLSNEASIDPTGGVTYNKEISKRFRF